jgi:hypothetical protein
MIKETTTLYRPVGPKELELIKQSDYTKFPPRLPEQPIFYPVMNKEYAVQITEQWNAPAYGSGYVTEFDVDSEYLNKFKVENVGGEIHNELWIPSEDLEEFNYNIIGLIRVCHVKKHMDKKMIYNNNNPL